MKKVLFSILLLAIGLSAMAQQRIQLRSADKAECVKSDMTSLKASFSFSTIQAEDVESERGTFSWLSMANTVIGGNEGDPQIPVINELIAVPFGAMPRVEITSYSTTDYRLEDLGIHTLVPRQPSLRKDQRPEDVPFVYNEAAYQSTRGFRSEPQAAVRVEGVMRGVQLGKMTIEPVSYDPVNNTLRVFNDIEITVHFDGADAHATEDMLLKTYSPYFDIVYKALFNGRAIMDAYSEHPDLYSTPVKMLVVTTSTFTSSTAFQNWLTWKKQKGINVDVQTVTSSTTAADVRSLIQTRYNATHPTFLVIVGDETQVVNYTTYRVTGLNYNPYVSDLQYASIDNDVYHDMYMSRMPVANTTQLGYLVDKILMYEKYTMTDPSYLNKTLLIAGWDSSWTAIAGKPTINYAANNYFNTAHGITPYTYITTGSGQTTCYNYISQVGFVNYTAHGDIQEWADPEFTNSNVNSLTNTGKPFWAMGNCCLTANFGNSSYNPCFGEAMVRAQNKGAFGYIGSVPESYWFEDLYFGVGAFAAQQSSNNNPTVSGTTTGCYDAMFDETGFNCLNSVPYIGNVAVTYAHAHNYNSSVSDEYYWRAYQCFGDGSVMPYLKVPTANSVSHDNSIPAGVSSFRVYADARSYVSITINNEIIGVAAVPANATYVDVPFTTAPVVGQTAMIVVTRNQRQPYINANVPVASNTQYTITANASPTSGGTVTGSGQYYGNSNCTLTATANHGYNFDNWTLNTTVVSTDPTYTFTVTGNATYTANFTAIQAHTITCNLVEHGTISANLSTAYEGDIITLTATPEANYHLERWNVRDANNNPITVTNNQFTMPDSDVTVSATFKSGYNVTVLNLIGGTITASATTAQSGATITLSVTPNTGYEFMSWNVYQTSNPSNTVTVANNRFTMPAYDVTVSAVFGVPSQVQVEETVIVGSGTSTTNGEYVPTYSATRNANYSLTEQIYTKSELGEAGTITAIELYNAGTNARTRTLQVYMVHTTNNNFSSNTAWIHPTSSDMVYSGSVTFTRNAWTTITFATPFEYNGTDNVALIVDDNTNSSQNGMSFYTYQGSDNQVIRIAGSTNYNPTSITSNASGRQANKNRLNVHITRTETQYQPLVCEAVPANVNISNVSPEGATIRWTGEADSYNIRYRTSSAFVYDFESATPWVVDDFAPCTTYDGDGSATGGIQNVSFTNQGYTGSFIAFQNGTSASNAYAHGGNAFGACFYATTPPNNDWFILPEMTIQSGDVFTFWARSFSSSYLETFNAGIYGGNGTFRSYLGGTASTPITAPVEWTEYSYDLSAFAGQTIQLAINCNSNDKFAFFIDDIFVGNSNGGSWERTIPNVTSPYTIEGLTDETLYEVQVLGVCDGIGESEGVGSSFTTLSWCSAPTALSASNVGASSADLSWTGYQDSYNLQYRTAGGRNLYLYTGFESGLPDDWTEINAGANTGVYSGAPNSGTYMYGFMRNGTNIQYLITPEIGEFEAGSVVAFYHMAYNADATIYVGYSSTTNATSAFTWGSAQTVTASTAYDLFTEEIPARTKYIAIRVSPVTDGAYYFIDDFMVAGPYVEPGEWHYVNRLANPNTTITDLFPETEYEWQVEGLACDGNGNTTGLSEEAYFVTASLCDAPVGLTAIDITATSATLNWVTDLDSYNLSYCIAARGDIVLEENLTFDGWQEWTPVTNDSLSSFYYLNSSHTLAGYQFSSTSTTPQYLISPEFEDLQGNSFVEFYYATDSNDETFKIGYSTTNDEVSSFTWGNMVSVNSPTSYTAYNTELPEGTKYFAIQYTSDHPTDSTFLTIVAPYVVSNYFPAGEATTLEGVTSPVTINDLTPNTRYAWQVQGINCDGNGSTTEWSSRGYFTTLFGLASGWNWWTPTTAMSLADLETALGGKGVIINSQDAGFARYENHAWSGTLNTIEPGKMYRIETTAAVSLTMTGTPVTSTEIAIMPGYNWFGYTGTTAKDIADALGSFTPEDGDQIIGQNGTVTYNRVSGRWTGGNFTQLVPGHGYVYFSTYNNTRTLILR